MRHLNRRDFVKTGLAAGAAIALPTTPLCARSANEAIRLGFISCGGRSKQLQGQFKKVAGVEFAAFCDPDRKALARMEKEYPKAQAVTDLRELLDNKSIDAVVIATCNHWHCLAAIWAMEAGKDVYVEKPLSHSQWEGRQTVNAARKYGRVCQVGTQQRSDPMQAEIKKFLHEEKALGEIVAARVNRYGVREPIGKRSTPLEIPSEVDYNLWLGPAKEEPLYRNKLHYDWHWDWNTGSGEMGNWGVHVLDDCRNVAFLDKVTLPKRICGGGGRVAWNDAGDTPNVHFVYFDTGSAPVVIGLTNIKASPTSKDSPEHPGPSSGYIVYCEGGRYEGQRGRGKAFDKEGKEIKAFKGNKGDVLHPANFIEAVRAQDSSRLNTDVEVGHYSTGWCNLANVAYRSGGSFSREMVEQVSEKSDHWTEVVDGLEKACDAHGIDFTGSDIKLSSMLEVDVEAETFVGENAEVANRFLKREYRDPFVVPDLS